MNHTSKILLLIFLLLLGNINLRAQGKFMNMPEHDNKAYYFGLSFGLNFSSYKALYDKSFATTDTFMYIQEYMTPGFSLGMMGNLKLNKRIDVRLIPSIAFSGKRLKFNAVNNPAIVEDRIVESILIHMPLQLKFKSDRIRNFRFYALAGGKLDYDLAANARSRRPSEIIKVKPWDYGGELGFGFEWYYPNFIFSPELKFSQGFNNQLYKGDRTIPLTNAIDQLTTRMIVLSIHLEG